jgi:hypothetical protein
MSGETTTQPASPAATISTEPAPNPNPAPTAEPSLVTQAPAPAFVPLEATALVLPEGFALDQKSSRTFLEIMNNQQLSPADRANALLNLQAELSRATSEAGSREREEQQQTWRQEVENDPVYGGANLPVTLANVGRVMDRFAPLTTPEGLAIREAFDRTGAGNNPAIVRFLANLGKDYAEPTPNPVPTPTALNGKSTAELMYGGGTPAA